MNANEIYTAIVAGQVDDQLDRIERAIEHRRSIAETRFDVLAPGDRVRIKTGIRPRYLQGAMATVVEKHITRLTVRFDADIVDPYGKWAGKLCVLPPTLIEVAPAEASV